MGYLFAVLLSLMLNSTMTLMGAKQYAHQGLQDRSLVFKLI